MPSSPDRSDNYQKGRDFEKLAAQYFKKNVYKILESNWRAGRNEIDLIVQKDKLIVFIEVKSSSSDKYGHPAERVDKRKILNLTKAAQQYLIAEDIKECDLRFDLVTFVNGQLEHYPDAFDAPDELF